MQLRKQVGNEFVRFHVKPRKLWFAVVLETLEFALCVLLFVAFFFCLVIMNTPVGVAYGA
jgi:hypothetical protein